MIKIVIQHTPYTININWYELVEYHFNLSWQKYRNMVVDVYYMLVQTRDPMYFVCVECWNGLIGNKNKKHCYTFI